MEQVLYSCDSDRDYLSINEKNEVFFVTPKNKTATGIVADREQLWFSLDYESAEDGFLVNGESDCSWIVLSIEIDNQEVFNKIFFDGKFYSEEEWNEITESESWWF